VRGVLAVLTALVLAGPAQASFIVDRNASAVSLRVSGGSAIVNSTTRGMRRSVVLAGASTSSAASPTRGSPSRAFARRERAHRSTVSWRGTALAAFDAAHEDEMNALQRSLGDRLCRHN